ncbi:MAG TPA: hypothetical protein VF169_10920 [Albitalea sp.]|uniref:hypothetical protein n=1 Tax=Piscinibacter sp. TaxID=1903157 RepID=UPI002ED430C0
MATSIAPGSAALPTPTTSNPAPSVQLTSGTPSLLPLNARDAAFALANLPLMFDRSSGASTMIRVLHALGAESAALMGASLVDFGFAKSFAEAAAGALLEQHWPGMTPAANVAAKAALAAPALALSLMASQVVIRPALLAIMGSHMTEIDPREVYPEPDDPTDQDAVREVNHRRMQLTAVQDATRIGRILPNAITFTAFGIAYGLRNVMEGASGTALTSTFASGAGGAMMGAGLSTLQMLAKTRDGQAAFRVDKYPDARAAIVAAFDSIAVATTADGLKTDSNAWRARNLAQHVGVLSLASVFGMMAANAYGEWLQSRESPSNDADAFMRGYGGVFFTVGIFFFATLTLTARRGRTDDRLMSGTRGALENLSKLEQPGSLEKLFRLNPGGLPATAAGVFEGFCHNTAIVATLPAHIALDLANVVTRPLNPPLPQSNATRSANPA